MTAVFLDDVIVTGKTQVEYDNNLLEALTRLTHSRWDLLNVMDFEHLQLGDLLGIMSVKGIWKKTN